MQRMITRGGLRGFKNKIFFFFTVLMLIQKAEGAFFLKKKKKKKKKSCNILPMYVKTLRREVNVNMSFLSFGFVFELRRQLFEARLRRGFKKNTHKKKPNTTIHTYGKQDDQYAICMHVCVRDVFLFMFDPQSLIVWHPLKQYVQSFTPLPPASPPPRCHIEA